MLETYMDATAISMIALAAAAPLTTILLLIQYYVHKKILDPTYYNANYFSSGELIVFASGFVSYLFKSILYIRAITLPQTMRVRFKKNILTFKAHPIIFLLAHFTMMLIILGGLVIINLFIFFGFWEYYN